MKDTQKELLGREESRLYKTNVPNSRKGLSEIIAATELTYMSDFERVHPEELDKIKDRTTAYLAHCERFGNLPTMQGYAGWLGISRKSLYEWLSNGKGPQTVDLLERIRDLFVDISTQAASSGKINPVTWIFYSKNYFEMQDSVELTVAPANSPLDPQKDEAELKRLYAANDVEDE